jgi:hypothetical protein
MKPPFALRLMFRITHSRCLLKPLALVLLSLLFAYSAGIPTARERRTLALPGSGGVRSCFAPFLNRQVEYTVNANAVWGFGNHVVKESTANVSANVLVSTQLASREKTSYWVHTLEVVRIWTTKSYAGQGSPRTETESMPVQSSFFRVRIVQTQCDRLGDIIHSPDVSPEMLEFARGLVSIILLTLPSGADTDFEEEVLHDGPNGPRPALLSIHRDRQPSALRDDEQNFVTHVTRLLNESKAPIVLHEDGSEVPLRDEIS